MEGGISVGERCEARSYHGYNGIERETIAHQEMDQAGRLGAAALEAPPKPSRACPAAEVCVRIRHEAHEPGE